MRTIYRYLKDEGIFGWNYWHLITHPYKIIQESYYHIKWFIQRGYRGYADCDNWSIDWYLCKWMPEAIRNLKNSHGVPRNFLRSFEPTTEEIKAAKVQWDSILEIIALGFEAAKRIQEYDYNEKEIDELTNTMNSGLIAFQQYFLSLWD